LGRGLDALLPSGELDEEERSGVREIPVSQISPSRLQPRQNFDPAKLAELADSIREHGLVQPVVVRPHDGGYELIVGERRWRAAQLAGLRVIPAVVKDFDSDADVLEIALVENLQREDLNPLEEASAFKYLTEDLGLTQEEVSRRVGRSRPQVANTLRLLNLDPEIQAEIKTGNVTMGHAKALLSLSDRGSQAQLFRRILAKGLSVREAEEAARRLARPPEPGQPGSRTATREAEAVLGATEEQLRNALGTKVKIRSEGGRGRLEIEFYSEEDMNRIVELIVG